MKRLGVLTSGGDCAGLNAVIRAVVQRAVEGYGWQVVGIKDGIAGLLARPVAFRDLEISDFTGSLLRRGGTVLGSSNRNNPLSYPLPDGGTVDRSDEVIEGYRSLNLDALIGIGGDGSLAILRSLAQKGDIPLVAVPKTIDNDIDVTEVSVGFTTAVGVATNALDHLLPTADSHSRIMVLEVMGRDAGHIALAAGIAGGADIILIPEIPYRIEALAAKIDRLRAQGKNFALAIVAEAVLDASGTAVGHTGAKGDIRYGGVGHDVAERLSAATGMEARVTVLGYLQRGGMPDPRDRLIASVFGVRAVDLVAEGRFDRMVAWRGRDVTDVPIEEAIATYRTIDLDGSLLQAARGLGIAFGDETWQHPA